MGGASWGGSEPLWSSVAEKALEEGDEVLISVYQWKSTPQKIIDLKNKGAILIFRKQYNQNAGLIKRVSRFIVKRKPSFNSEYQSILNFRPDTILISQGDTFDLALSHWSLYNSIKKSSISYSLICHSHQQYSYIPPQEIYPLGQEVFTNAKNVFFISLRQWKLTERRLVCKLNNGSFTWNPLNFNFLPKPLEWPIYDGINFAIVGVLDGSKGQDTALEVFSGKQWKSRNWKLNFYGTGAGEKYLKDLANFYGIEQNVNFCGFEKNILKVWQENHVLLIPSSWEGMPISLVEAMVCGRPCVANDVGGISEIVNNKNGFISSSPTVGSFNNAMEELWACKDTLIEMGKEAHDSISKIFNADSASIILEKIRKNKL